MTKEDLISAPKAGPEAGTYHETGYELVRDFFSPYELDIIRGEAQQVFNEQINRLRLTGMEDLFTSHFDIFSNCGKQAQHLISLHRLSLSPKIQAFLNRLGLERPVIATRPVLYFNKKSLAKSEEFYKVPAHQDWRSMQGSLNSIVVWVPLVDVDKDLGALQIIPGSHKLGLLDSTENKWFRQVEAAGAWQDVEVRKGDALFFSSFLVHRSGDNKTDNIRWSAHFRYNDLSEPTFIDRGYPHPYIYKPQQELITPNFPNAVN